tara:strand:+ start:189 stop:416 length:228 start_codon:yes stop_codon:yes gene_type:complete
MLSLGTVVSFIKAVPMVKSIFDKLVDLYVESEITKLHDQRINKKQERNALLLSIARCQTDEERKTYSIMLANLSR